MECRHRRRRRRRERNEHSRDRHTERKKATRGSGAGSGAGVRDVSCFSLRIRLYSILQEVEIPLPVKYTSHLSGLFVFFLARTLLFWQVFPTPVVDYSIHTYTGSVPNGTSTRRPDREVE